MEDIKITKDATSLLKRLHAAYKKRVKNGQPKQEAIIFGGTSDIRQEIRSKWSLEDIEDTCGELWDKGLLECVPGDDEIQTTLLTKAGIAYAENQAAGIIRGLWGLIKEILPFIP